MAIKKTNIKKVNGSSRVSRLVSRFGKKSLMLAVFVVGFAVIGVAFLLYTQAADLRAMAGENKTLANQMLANKNITYWDTDSGHTSQSVRSLATNGYANTTCLGNKNVSVTVNPNMLRYILEVASRGRIAVNAITDKCHVATSNHYKGLALDLEDTVGNISDMRSTAARYGAKFELHNGNHYHLDFPAYGAAGTPTPTGPVAAPKSPIGNIDELSCNTIRGWTFDQDDSNRSIEVHIYIDGGGHNTGTTTTARPDVNNYYKIGGTHGYNWTVPSQYRNGKSHQVTVYGINIGPSANHFSMTRTMPACGAAATTQPSGNNPPKITIKATCSGVSGTALDADSPNGSVFVDIYINSGYSANHAQPDIRTQTWPNTASQYNASTRDKWGYNITTPKGHTRTYYAYVLGKDRNGNRDNNSYALVVSNTIKC